MKATKNYVMKSDLSHEDWLEGRKRYIGASETAAVLGLDRYKTPYDLWKWKTAPGIEELEEGSIGAQRASAGLRAEQMIADWIGEKYGLVIRRDNKIRIHPRLPFWSANLDRVVVNNPSGPGTLELKTTSRESLKSWNINADEPNAIFMHHWVQVQAQMAISGFQWGAIGVMPADSFLGFGEPDLIEIERDNEFIEMMEREIEEFWTKYVMTNTPPPAKTLGDLQAIYPIAGPPPIEVTEDVYLQVRTLKELKEKIKRLEAEAKEIDFQVRVMMGNSDSATYQGQEILTYKNNQETLFDADGFAKDFVAEAEKCKVVDRNLVKQDYPELFEKYATKVDGARVLRLKLKTE